MTAALFGGMLIGLAAAVLWFGALRVAGVSGLVRDALRGAGADRLVGIAFLLGLVAAGAALGRRGGSGAAPTASLAVAGFLVGFGARVGGGCTSGHGVCGLSRFSVRSLVATAVFMTTGAATVFVIRHVVGGSGGAP
jgi:uncharacterized membrane protein YedE/YeeE